MIASYVIVLLDRAERGLDERRNAHSIEWLSRPRDYCFNKGGVR
jgi:hypothetical protein